jgi:hypothetical protein
VEGTPVFDIKPYIPAYDSFPESRAGWLEEIDNAQNNPPAFEIIFSSLATEHIQWLKKNWGIDFTERLQEILSRDPSPHRTRRIRSRHGNLFDIGCGAWYAVFEIKNQVITILSIKPAFPLKFLTNPERPEIPDKEAQLTFRSLWPQCVD